MPTEPDFDAVAIFRVLNRHAVDYVVVGGFAVVLDLDELGKTGD